MTDKKLRVGIFADDLSRGGMGTALVLRQLLQEYKDTYKDKLNITLIYRDEMCTDKLCKSFPNLVIRQLPLPKFRGFFSYFWFFLFFRDEFDAVHYPRPMLHPFFWLQKVLGRTKKIIVTFHGAPESKNIPIFETPRTKFNRFFIRWFGKYFIDIGIVDTNSSIFPVCDYYKMSREKVTAIHLGVDTRFRMLSNEEKEKAKKLLKTKYNIITPYVLSVARFDPHKNIHRIIRAFEMVQEKEKISHTLVLVGGKHEPAYSKKIEKQIENSPVKEKIYIAPFIEDEDLPALYNMADVLLFPSLSEGFGLPILESFACGTLVITSSVSCMPEIAGDAAIKVNPYSSFAIREALETVLYKKIDIKELIERGEARSKKFSWEKTAHETYKLYYCVEKSI